MDLTTSIYNGINYTSTGVDYYWQYLKYKFYDNYYYYFPPKPPTMVFMVLDPDDTDEVSFIKDELGNSVYVHDDSEN